MRYKRQYREMPDVTKRKISQTLKAKKIKHSSEWNQKISEGLKAAWAKIPAMQTVKKMLISENKL